MNSSDRTKREDSDVTVGVRVDAQKIPVADLSRRHLLVTAVTAVGALGVGAVAWPFVKSFSPSARARVLGGPVSFDMSQLKPGEEATLMWRGQPVWVLRRTKDMLERLQHVHWRTRLRDPDSEIESQQPTYAQNATRSIRPEYLVVVALCTHLGCVPSFKPQVPNSALGDDWMGGYFCPCHGSSFDLAGRVTKGVPAPTNLVVPPHHYVDDNTLVIGVDHV